MDKINYAVKRRGVRYSVHVGYLTKVEAAGLLASVATIQNDRHVIGPIEREDIINAVENPEVLDPPPMIEWLAQMSIGERVGLAITMTVVFIIGCEIGHMIGLGLNAVLP